MTKTLAPPKPKYSRHFSSLKQFLRSLLPKPTSLHILILLPFSPKVHVHPSTNKFFNFSYKPW